MKWFANILLNSGNYVSLENLISINAKKSFDGSIEKTTDFKTFHIPRGQELTFVGEKDVVSINSNEIKYVQFTQD